MAKKKNLKKVRFEEKFKNKNFLIILGTITITIIIILLCIGKGDNFILTNPDKNVKIVESANKKIKYQTFDNGLIKLNVPEGWIVKTLGDYIHYTFLVTDPTCEYKVFLNLKSEGYFKSNGARNFMIKYYGSSSNSYLPVLAKQTTLGFYGIFNKLGEINNTKSFTFPVINNFNVIENMGKTIYGGDLLRASYKANDKDYEGLFTATVSNPGNYYVNSNPFDFSSAKVDTYPLNVYNTIFISGPKDEFVNYSEILTKVIESLEFSQTFLKGFNASQDAILKTIKANSKIYNEMSDMIMSSWEKRNISYDITSQKQSDATLGYERVYDVENNEIYKAYNGFLDDYKGERYQPVTDQMYTEKISGYIEKAR